MRRESGGRGMRHGRRGHGGGHGMGMRGGHHGRGFEHGKLRFVILQLIDEQPTHGYELIKAIEEKTGGAYTPSPGVIYPTLTLLEELGHVAVNTSDANRKLYTITPEGKQSLAENKEAVGALGQRMGRRGIRHSAAPSIVRAMENLKTALRLRLAQGELNAKQSQAIAAAIDAAAVEIEGL